MLKQGFVNSGELISADGSSLLIKDQIFLNMVGEEIQNRFLNEFSKPFGSVPL